MKTKNNSKSKWLILLAIALCGCQQLNEKRSLYVRNRERDYLSSSVIAPLKIPEDLSHPNVSEDYSLPSYIPAPGSVAAVTLMPPGFGQLSQ